MSEQVAQTNEPVTFINAFKVPTDESERFLRRWKENARGMAHQPGFIRARMYRALASDVEFGFINVSEWDSEKALADAMTKPELQDAKRRILDAPDLHVTPQPAVYQIAVEVHPDDPR